MNIKFTKAVTEKAKPTISLQRRGGHGGSRGSPHPGPLPEGEGKDEPAPRLLFRAYQREAFEEHRNGIEVWLWGRQTGKSFTLAAWAVDRLLRHPGRLVTILSNSRANGMELNLKCGEICQALEQLFEQEDLSVDRRFETMNYETRITIQGRVGRIKVLPANPRTARGFSGDLVLDEFAHHENSVAIWEAVEPILSAHPDYLCRIASTPNGRHNMFYRLATNPQIPVRKVPRTEAWRQGLRIFHPITRAAIGPEEARALAVDKRAYDQNYECVFENENMALLTYELIAQAERDNVGVVCEENWSAAFLEFFSPQRHGERREEEGARSTNFEIRNKSQIQIFNQTNSSISNLFLGVDVGRNRDLTVMTVLEKSGPSLIVRGILRLQNMRLPEQQERLAVVCRQRQFRGAQIDMTGLGLGLVEYSQKQFGGKIRGINFASSVPISPQLRMEGRRHETVRVTEHLATQLLKAYEDRQIQHPIDEQLREELRKPERLVSPSGRVSIAASRDGDGHADHFWSLALAVNAAVERPVGAIQVVRLPSAKRMYIPRNKLLC